MTAAFVPPEPPPPQVAEHLRHMTDGHWHDRCRFCRRRRTAPSDSKSGPRGWDKGALGPEPGTSPREKGGTGVLAEDYLPPVHIGAVQDVLVGFRGLLDPPPNGEAAASHIEGEAWDDPLPPLPPRGPCTYDGMHCWHWSYTSDPCCHCGSETDSDDDALGG